MNVDKAVGNPIRTCVRLKQFKSLYQKLYLALAKQCSKRQLYKRSGLIRVLDVTQSTSEGINFTVKGYSEKNKKQLPDYFIADRFQHTLLAKFNDELDDNPWTYPYGILELENARFAFPYVIHRMRNTLVNQGIGDSAHCLCQPRYLLAYLSTFLPAKQNFDAVILLLIPFFENYYHWTIETLPRLKLIAEDSRFNRLPILLPKQRCPGFVVESISLAGFSGRILFLETGTYKANKIVIPTLYAPRSELSFEAVQWLNDKILGTGANDSVIAGTALYERIFISREDADTRQVVNSEELDQLLAKFQIKKIKMMDYSLRDQARLFNGAKVVIGLHGAALANVVYCKRDSTLLELFMEGLFTKAFYNLARFKGMQYGCLLCQQDKGNIVIDIQMMEKIINVAIEKPNPSD